MGGFLYDLALIGTQVVERRAMRHEDQGCDCLDLVTDCCQKGDNYVKTIFGVNFGALIILYSKIGGHVLTPFLVRVKIVKKD